MLHTPADDWIQLKDSLDPEYSWLVPGLWEFQDRLIITGNEGKGKSTFIRQVSLRIAAGIHPFEDRFIEPKRVLLVDCENNRKQIKRKMKEMPDCDLAPGYLSICPWTEGMDLMKPEEQAALAFEIEKCEPDLLAIGPTYKLMPDLLKPECSIALMHLLDFWRVHYNFMVIMESHQPHEVGQGRFDRFRPERPYGPSEWMRWPEFGFCLEDDGRFRAWRGSRDERDFPEKFKRGGNWPWEIDALRCFHCNKELTGQQQKYCSAACKNAEDQSAYRQRHRS